MNPFPFGGNDFHRFGRVEDPYRIFEIADVPDENEASMNESEQPSYVGLTVGESKLRTVFALLFLVLAVLLGRAVQLQLVNGAHYAALSEGNRIRVEPLISDRGVIYDRSGEKLAINVPNFAAAVRPGSLPTEWNERQNFLVRLASILNVDPIVIEERLRDYSPSRSSNVIVADNLTREQAILMEIESSSNDAVFLTSGSQREYPSSGVTPSLSHLLGYVGKVTEQDLADNDEYLSSDVIGKTGLESSYESILRGRYGRRRIEVDASGRLVKVAATDVGDDGRDIKLAIDLGLQRDVEKILQGSLEKAKAARGAVIVMNPNNGDLLSLVSWPAYDNNLFARGISSEEYSGLLSDENRPLFNRAVSGLLPSGSTFKLVVAAAALAEGLITPTTSVVSSGGVRVGRWFFPDWKAGGHGVTDVTKAIAESVNTFFYVIGGGHDSYGHIKPLGITKIAEYARRFGLGSRTGIDLPSEAQGFVPTPEWKSEQRGESWYVGDTYHVAIGQGDILVTPLQVARYTAAIANGGYLVTPRLVASVITPDGQDIPQEVKRSSESVVPSAAVKTVQTGMRRTVTQGSARSLGTLPWEIAAKTGTAQWNSNKKTHAWFTSYAPYENPEIVVTVVVEEGGEGSSIGAAIAKSVYQRYFSGALPSVTPPITPEAHEAVQDIDVTITPPQPDEPDVPQMDEPAPIVAPPAKPSNPVSNVMEWIFDSQ